jgi:hypothetical protein
MLHWQCDARRCGPRFSSAWRVEVGRIRWRARLPTLADLLPQAAPADPRRSCLRGPRREGALAPVPPRLGGGSSVVGEGFRGWERAAPVWIRSLAARQDAAARAQRAARQDAAARDPWAARQDAAARDPWEARQDAAARDPWEARQDAAARAPWAGTRPYFHFVDSFNLALANSACAMPARRSSAPARRAVGALCLRPVWCKPAVS